MNRCLSSYSSNSNENTSTTTTTINNNNNDFDELYNKILSNCARRYSCIPSSNLTSYSSLNSYYNNLLLIYNSKLYQNSKLIAGNRNMVKKKITKIMQKYTYNLQILINKKRSKLRVNIIII